MHFWLIIFLTLLCFILSYLKIKYSYWYRKDVEQLKPHCIWGNIPELKSLHHGQFSQMVYDTFKTKTKLAGVYIFTKPVAVILDLDLVKSVLIKDFHNFSSRMTYKNDRDILSQHLFNVEGPLWRPLRNKISPIFSSAKMKYMFCTIRTVTEEFLATYEKCLQQSDVLDVHDLNGRYTVDVIGTLAYGIECNSLKDPTAEFRQISLKIFGRKSFNIKWHLFKQTYIDLMKFFGHKRYPQFIEDFFQRVMREGVLEREKNGIVRNDFVDLLLELKKSQDMPLTNDQISAQLFVFFAAGFETSAQTMSNLLFELGRHPEIQEKVRDCIQETLKEHNNELTYEAMIDMKYLDQAIKGESRYTRKF